MDNSSSSNIHTIVRAQVVFLLSTLTEENFERNQLEIRSLAEQHGSNTYLHFIRRLIIQSQARLTSTATPSAFDTSSSLTFRLLVQETQRLARDPFLADRFREGIDKGDGEIFRHFDLGRFSDRVGLRPLERFILAASIAASSSVRKELAAQAAAIIRVEFEGAVLALLQHPCFDHADLSPAQAGKLLQNLLSDPPLDQPLLDTTKRLELISAAQARFGAGVMSPMLQQLFTKLSLPPGTSLVQTLIQLGSEITSDVEVVRGLLSRFGFSEQNPPSDTQAVEIFTTLGRFAAEGASLCDVGALVRALSNFSVQPNWSKVIKSFDLPERHGVDTATLKLLIAVLTNSPRDVVPPAVAGFWTNWANPMYQLRLLDALLSLPNDTFNFVTLPGRRVVTVDDVASASPTIKSLAANVQSHTWNSLDLFEVLVRLGESDSSEVRAFVRDMLDKAVRISADIVHMGLLQVPKPWNAIQVEYTNQLLGMFLAGHPNHQLVFMRIWQIEPSYLTTALREHYEENPMNITRILDIAQDLKILDSLLEVRPFTFALDVAALASRREYLNLDKWLADNVNTHGSEFLHSIINFLDLKAQNEKIARTSDPSAESRTMGLSAQTIAIFLRVLRNSSSLMDERDVDYCIEVRNACLQIYPRLMNLSPGSDQEPGFSVISYSADVEAEVDGIYKQMYDEQITIDGVIALLQRTKESTSPHDHEIFSCMLHFLFEEYKFFQNCYPPRELAMTGYLFGSLIQHQLVDYIPLGIAIRYVLDALQCPPETNLFKFGIQALSRFESRLSEWRPLCQALIDIPHLAEARPDVAESIRRALAAPPSDIGTGVGPLPGLAIATGGDAQPAFTAIRPDILEDDHSEPPSEEVSDKILFIVNNLAPNNFDSKLTEMKERFKDVYSRWFASYLVDQRVSTEPNNHQLYLRLLDGLDSPLLARFILHETISKSASLLNSEKTKQSSLERTVLKNLGSWLGQITVARDKPIKQKNISFKELLLEGADSDCLLIVIPFVCKVLEACGKSRVFKPPNPWLNGVMSLLAELYQFADLKLQLKFEIEVLCGALGLQMDQIDIASVYRARPPLEPSVGPDLPDYPADIDSLPIGGYDHLSAEGQALPLPPSSPAEAQRAVGSHIESILVTLASTIKVNAQLAPLNTNQSFKRAIQLAVDRSVREIILPVVERSVTIATITTRELGVKDFASEVNEDRLRKAGQIISQRLASSLALVTCKEPLKSNMPAHIRQYLNEQGFNEQMVPEQVVQMIVQDNLDVACATIEKAATDRATAELEEALTNAWEARRRHIRERPDQVFWDPSIPQSQFTLNLPDILRIKPGGLTVRQLRVYEDFASDDKRRFGSRPSSSLQYTRDQPGLSVQNAPSMMEAHQASLTPTTLSHTEALEKFNNLVAQLESAVIQLPSGSIAALPPNHEIRTILRRIIQISVECADRSQTPLILSQKLVQHLYKTNTQLGREAYTTLLEQLCRSFEEVAKQAITWLLFADDDRKFNIPVMTTLLRFRLIPVSDQDQQLAKSLYEDPRQSLQNFTAGLIRECLTSTPPIAAQAEYSYTLRALAELVHSGKATEAATQLIHELRGSSRQGELSRQEVTATAKQSPDMQAYLSKCFQQWVSVFQRSSSPEKAFVPYITQLTKQGILKAEDVSSLFFRVCAEISVSHCSNAFMNGDYENAFLAIDALSRLIVYIIKYHGDATGANNDQAKTHYFSKIMSIVVLVVANLHEDMGVGFQQKPFFRLFSTLLNDLHAMEAHLGNAYLQLLISLSDTFSSLQPMYFPGFAFSWMTLVSHRLFMPKLLLTENREGWAAFHKLSLALLRFMAPFLRTADMQIAARNLYRGLLRLLLVLLHDFPEFLSEYYFTLCDAIPSRCVQLRNLVLSAYPPTCILPDPHVTSIKLESIPEMGPIPAILSDFTSALKNGDLRAVLDQCLLNRVTTPSLAALVERLRVPTPSITGEGYNLTLVNASVMYIGVSSVAQAKARSGSALFVAGDPGVVALTYLAGNLDAEGQHHLMSAIVLQLRFPNAHTHWFSSLLLHLFLEIKDERFREITTKVLLERFIVHRPHPWGALVTFIELLRNPKYDFWGGNFVRAVPEVALLLDSVARSILSV